LLLATLYTAVAATLIYGCVFGWAHFTGLFKQAAASIAAGDISTCLGLFIAAALAALSRLAASLLIYFALSLAILTLARIRGGKAWRSLIAWKPWSIWRAKRSYWIIGGCALVYSLIANAAIAYLYPPSKDWFSVPHDNLSSALQLFVLAVIFAPIAEELMFRGWIYTALRARFGFWIALFVSSAIFAGLHYEDTHIYALAVFPVGLALGALRETSGSLKASISFHAFFNMVAFGLALLDLG
jgi:membrane protease YdiL (CAAX protease family)